VLGAQANVWTEFITSREHLEYMVLPRMLALSEVLWTPKSEKNYTDFYRRLQNQFVAFEEKGFHYCPGNFTVAIKPSSENGKLFVTLSSEIPDARIYYTTNGNDPDATSNQYENPIPIDSSVTVKAIIVIHGKVMGVQPAQQKFVMHKAVGKNVTYTNPVSRYYPADGTNTLTDGVRGTTAVNKYWHGLQGKDLIATIDMGNETSIQNITIGCLQHYSDWIFLPQSVTFEISNDGTNFTDLGTVKNAISPDEKSAVIKDFTLNFPAQKARYIRVTAKNLGVCPKGHPGEGQPAWIFADEIMVN
jgi:hexosaminidase